MSVGNTIFNRVTETREGPMIYNVNDVYIGRSIELYGEFSALETDFLDQILRPGLTVIELGAHIGSHAVHIAKRLGPEGVVHAFEPQRMLFQLLCGNVALNNLANVATHHAAVGAGAGEVVVPPLDYTQPNNFGGVALGGYDRGEKVPVIALDDLDLLQCHLIKADIEGMEEDAFRGAVNTIAKFRPFLYFECDRKEKVESLLSFVDSLDYDLFWHRPPLFNPQNFRANPENVFGNLVSNNVLGVPRGGASNITGLEQIVVGAGPSGGAGRLVN